jgi:hypothetical protein
MIVPIVLRAAWFVIIRSTINVLGSLWVGVPNACRWTANEWVDRAHQAGIDSIYFRQIYWAVYIVTLLIILASWTVYAHITVFLFSLLF